jgi:RNA polymerase primary sigma factor
VSETYPEDLARALQAQESISEEEDLRLSKIVAESVAEQPEAASEEAREARSQLIVRNLGLVAGLARRYRWSGVPLADLFQEGVLGLFRATERFDWNRGTPFSAYAAWWVRHGISRAVRDATTSVRLPDRQWKVLRQLGRAKLARPDGTIAEVAADAGVDRDQAELLVPLLGSPVSLDAALGEAGSPALADLLADREAEEELEQVLVRSDIERLLQAVEEVLTPREREVLEARYGLGGRATKTLREVGDELGVTAQRVAQIEGAALEKLREALGVEASA